VPRVAILPSLDSLLCCEASTGADDVVSPHKRDGPQQHIRE
jgi:hypothetical protein